MASRRDTTVEAGRTYDIDFINWTDDVEGQAQFTFGNQTRKTTGVVKVVNRFLKILLTRKGSDPFNRSSGTYFDDIQSLGGYSDDELGTYVTEQLNDALAQVKSIQSRNSFPLDENISTVSLEDLVRPVVDQAIFYVRIITEAGEGVTVKVPLIGG